MRGTIPIIRCYHQHEPNFLIFLKPGLRLEKLEGIERTKVL